MTKEDVREIQFLQSCVVDTALDVERAKAAHDQAYVRFTNMLHSVQQRSQEKEKNGTEEVVKPGTC